MPDVVEPRSSSKHKVSDSSSSTTNVSSFVDSELAESEKDPEKPKKDAFATEVLPVSSVDMASGSSDGVESLKDHAGEGKAGLGSKVNRGILFVGRNTRNGLIKSKNVVLEYFKFVGPGMMISIAYIDPGNYSTDVAAGAAKRFHLLFMVLLSNILAVFLQTLSIKLGTVTGQDLAVNCRRHFPKYLNWFIYFCAEAAIIATDIAEVIGTAIALNVLIRLPLMAGVCLTILDVVLVLLAYKPGAGMTTIRIYEYLVAALLVAVVICFTIQLSQIPKQPIGEVFKGYLPTHSILTGNGLFLACGILGATVMPHSLYLGSSLVKPRIIEFDKDNGNYVEDLDSTSSNLEAKQELIDEKYKASISAIRYVMKYSIAEVAISLCTLALFVNSSIIIVAGATLYGLPEAVGADLYSIHHMLGVYLSPISGTVFMLALLFSGQSAGIICTLAGQIVCEGHVRWNIKPWIRRIVTRLLSILPCLIVVGAAKKEGLSSALNASQVCLSILLPFLSLPLIWLTSSSKVMTVDVQPESNDVTDTQYVPAATLDFSNSIMSKLFGAGVWILVTILNVYLIIHLGIYGE